MSGRRASPRSLRWPGKARIDRGLGGVLNEAAENSLADARHAEARALLAGWFGWLKAEVQANSDRELARAWSRPQPRCATS